MLVSKYTFNFLPIFLTSFLFILARFLFSYNKNYRCILSNMRELSIIRIAPS